MKAALAPVPQMEEENVGVHLMINLKGTTVKCFKVTLLSVVCLKPLA